MAKQLDRTRPFGTTLCEGEPTIKYHQDNRYFNRDGEEVNSRGRLMSEIEAEAREAEKEKLKAEVKAEMEAEAAQPPLPRAAPKKKKAS